MEVDPPRSRTRGPTANTVPDSEQRTRRQRRARHRRTRKCGEAVGVKVIVEVLDHWSDLGLTRGERDDLLVIAENVNDISRETFNGIHHDYILKRAGKQSAATWRNAVGILMKRGVLAYAVRGGVEQSGHRGRVAVYRIPVLCPEPPHDGLYGQCTRSDKAIPGVTHSIELGHLPDDPMAPKRVTQQMTQSPAQNHPADDPIGRMGHPPDGEWVTPQMTPTPLSPQKNSPLSAPLAAIRKFVGLTEEEERELERWIAKEHKPHGPGWWRKLAANGDLAVIIESWKVRRTPTPPRINTSRAPQEDPVAEPGSEYRAAREAKRARSQRPNHGANSAAYDLAREVLDGLDPQQRARWRSAARAELHGAQQADDRAVTVKAAQLLAASNNRSREAAPDSPKDQTA